MERRTDLKLDSDTPLTITLMQEVDGNWSGQLVEQTEQAVLVRLSAQLNAGDILKLETADEWALAEVSGSHPSGDEFCASLKLLEWISKSELREYMAQPAIA